MVKINLNYLKNNEILKYMNYHLSLSRSRNNSSQLCNELDLINKFFINITILYKNFIFKYDLKKWLI